LSDASDGADTPTSVRGPVGAGDQLIGIPPHGRNAGYPGFEPQMNRVGFWQPFRMRRNERFPSQINRERHRCKMPECININDYFWYRRKLSEGKAEYLRHMELNRKPRLLIAIWTIRAIHTTAIGNTVTRIRCGAMRTAAKWAIAKLSERSIHTTAIGNTVTRIRCGAMRTAAKWAIAKLSERAIHATVIGNTVTRIRCGAI